MRTIIALIMGLVSIVQSAPLSIDLSGTWRFALDKQDQGIEQKWFAGDLKTTDTIHLPGSLQEQGFGDTPSLKTDWTTGIGKELLKDPRFQSYLQADTFKSPFWLTPYRHYVGPAWYQRKIVIPENFGGNLVLFLERPHWKTTVWLGEEEIGSSDSLGTPHQYTLFIPSRPSDAGILSQQRRLTIRVDNRVVVPVGYDAHSVSDQTQSNWNGIIGRIELLDSEEHNWLFEEVQIHPDIKTNTIKVCVDLSNPLGSLYGKLFAQAQIASGKNGRVLPKKTINVKLTKNDTRIEFTYAMGKDALLWDEFTPNLYTLKLRFEEGPRKGWPFNGQYQTTFGMRQLDINGTQFTINGRNIFLRGTLECCIFPKTGYPPMDVESWRKILRACKAHGLNHLRFHSWCPPEAAFIAADEMGFYYQVEASCWAAFGDGTAADDWIYKECDRMIRQYGNHPSFILMVPSNEPAGSKKDAFLGKLVTYLTQKDNRRRYSAGSGWPHIQENNYHITYAVRLQNYPTLRLSDPPQTFTDYRDEVAKYKVPLVSHEIGQWCVYPDPSEQWKYTGFLKGANIEIARDMLAKAGMGQQGRDFVMASGKFQALLYKQEIETALRTPGFGGFQLLDLHDFPGQGTAPVGVLDCFWESKGYITPEQYSRFCGPTIPLARLKKRVFTNDQNFEAVIDIAHYGPAQANICPTWYIRDDDGRVLMSGQLDKQSIPTGIVTTLGKITVPLSSFTKAAKLNLEIALANLNLSNDWDFWVYPASLQEPKTDAILISSAFDDKTIAVLKQGGTVLLNPSAASCSANTLGTFRPIFWNRITFPSQPEHTMGILCDPAHPAFTDFPTDYYSNWQWQDLLDHSKPVVLSDMDNSIQPMIQVIDDWNLCRKLADLFEAKVANGKLLFCSIDIQSNLQARPVARQLRHSLLSYLNSDKFNPAQTLKPEFVQDLFN